MPKPSVSVVVPVFNSETILPHLIERLEKVLVDCAFSFEVILVNDGSADRSWEVLERLSRERPFVRAIDLLRNYGQHNALLAGIRAVRHDTVVTLDDDLQHPPEAIPALLEKLEAGFDLVYGCPEREQHGLFRDLASVVVKMGLQAALGTAHARQVSAFRAFRKQVAEASAGYRSPFVSIDVLLSWGTNHITSVRVPHASRFAGRSNYTVRKLVRHTLNMVTGFSTLPLQLASLIGFGFTLFGFSVLLYVVGRYLIEGGVVPGFPFLASIIAIFSGAQLFALGIFGEYLARIHFRMMDRPAYVVRREARGSAGT